MPVCFNCELWSVLQHKTEWTEISKRVEEVPSFGGGISACFLKMGGSVFCSLFKELLRKLSFILELTCYIFDCSM